MGKTRNAVAATGAWQLASLLLTYPDDLLIERLPLLDAAVRELPANVSQPLSDVVAYVRSTPLNEQQEGYVATFDMRKKCCPYLTWWVHGDTRNRGYALVEFKAAYRDAGVTPPTNELPDHVAVVLEFAARIDPDAGSRLLTGHRPALEAMRSALQKAGSPFGRVLDAVVATLPAASADSVAATSRIAANGPPIEMVGLEPYRGAR